LCVVDDLTGDIGARIDFAPCSEGARPWKRGINTAIGLVKAVIDDDRD